MPKELNFATKPEETNVQAGNTDDAINEASEPQIIPENLDDLKKDNVYEGDKSSTPGNEGQKTSEPPAGNKGQEKPKNQKPSNGKSSVRTKLQNLEQKVEQLEAEKRNRAERTPELRLSPDKMQLVYTGKVAGKTAHRALDIIDSEDFRSLYHILKPIVALANAQIKGQNLEENIYRDREGNSYTSEGKPVYKATALTKATYAFSALLKNQAFCDLMSQANAKAEEILKTLSPPPGELELVTHEPNKTDGLTPTVRELLEKVSKTKSKDKETKRPKGPGE